MVRAVLIFEVRAVRQSSDCVLWRMVPLGATLLSTHSAAGTAGSTASGMAEIGRVKLQFAAARHGTAPGGGNDVIVAHPGPQPVRTPARGSMLQSRTLW